MTHDGSCIPTLTPWERPIWSSSYR